MGQKVFCIAEIGINHGGNGDTAAQMIRAAKEAGADMAKFQSYRAAEFLGVDSPYYEEANKAQFSNFALKTLSGLCQSNGIEFGLSLFHADQVEFAEHDLGLKRYKVASKSALNLELLSEINKTKKPVIMSVGLCKDSADISNALEALRDCHVAMLYCICEYPTPLGSIDLSAMDHLQGYWGLPVGFSSHCPLAGPTIAAVSLGATITENHILPPPGMPYYGCDSSSSMPMPVFSSMVKTIREIEAMP